LPLLSGTYKTICQLSVSDSRRAAELSDLGLIIWGLYRHSIRVLGLFLMPAFIWGVVKAIS
jgi:hypothetical protein